MSKASIRIEQDPVIEIELEDSKADSYYLSRHVATIAERVIAALKEEPK